MPDITTILMMIMAITGLLSITVIERQRETSEHKDRIIESKDEEMISLLETNYKLYQATIALEEERRDK